MQPQLLLDEPSEIKQVPDLIYQDNYISQAQEKELLCWIDSNVWQDDLERRVQHYGWRYDYKARKIDSNMRLGTLPDELLHLAKQIYQDGLVGDLPDQVIINEYQPGQGITNHIDCETCFGDDITTISLNTHCIMEFTEAQKTNHKLNKKKPKMPKHIIETWLNRRSIVVIKGDARWWWFHGIRPRKKDKWQGMYYPRGRRISLTFRKISGGEY